MNKKVISIVLGIMCFALTLGIFIQLKTVKGSNSIVGQSNYQEDELRAEVLKYKEKYDNTYNELEKAEKQLEKQRQNSTENNSELEQKEEEIKQGNKMIGLTDVTGPGVIITLNDSKKDASTVLNSSDLLIHNGDVLSIINELKNAGAEAISINDQRVTNMTDIADITEKNIVINSQRITSPYTVKAIGDKSYLSSTLNLKNSGYVDLMKVNNLDITVEQSDYIEINKYSKELKVNTMKEAE